MTRTASPVDRSRDGITGRRLRDARSGFSLIEVILSTAILLGSVVVLGELAAMGRRQSIRGGKLAAAQRLCELTLNELLTGLRPLEPQEQEPLLPPPRWRVSPLDDGLMESTHEDLDPFPPEERPSRTTSPDGRSVDAPWLHSIRIEPLENFPGLAVLTVRVEEAADVGGRPVRFQLSRWIEDPFATEMDETIDDRQRSLDRPQESVAMSRSEPQP